MMHSGGDGHDKDNPWDDDSNVVPLKVPRTKRKKWGQHSQHSPEQPPEKPKNNEPMINLPPVTKYILLGLLAIHLFTFFWPNKDVIGWIYLNLGFIPAHFTGAEPFKIWYVFAPLTHMFLHGSWLHIAMNGVMLLAFGSGIEKWLGPRRMLEIFLFSGLCGAILHFILNIDSVAPVVGASGGLSGLFAAALIMMSRYGGQTGRFGIWPFVLLWIGISVILGGMGSPDGAQIAWAAHIGGFLGGFLILKLRKLF